MKVKLEPEIYKGADQLNYICIIATEMLGVNTLKDIPSLLTGYESLLKTLPNDVRQALLNVRLSGFAPGTLRELSLMIEKYREHHRIRDRKKAVGDGFEGTVDQRYVVNDDYTVTSTWTKFPPDDLLEAIKSLAAELPNREYPEIKYHEPMRSAEINRSDIYNCALSPLGFAPPDPVLYPTDHTSCPPKVIKWESLIAIANKFDEIDVKNGDQDIGSRSWFYRLHDCEGKPTAELLVNESETLNHTNEITLSGIKHLIGLPGAGKTTLLFLIAAYLYKNNYKACFLFPSIEVAAKFIETLKKYEIDVALLSGQASSSRARHALNFANSLSNNNNGFAFTKPTAKNFSTNCSLAGFVSDEETGFPHESPPCQEIMQGEEGKRKSKRQCSLSSICGYQFSERNLSTTPLWAGHILSLDRKVSSLFSSENIHHFEYIAQNLDVLIVDECDGAQNNLDERGTPIMKLVGDIESLWSTLLTDIHQPAAGGRNAFFASDTYPELIEMTGRFGRASERLLSRVSHLSPKSLKEQNANKLHTANSIIWEIFADDEDPDKVGRNNKRKGIELLWDVVVKNVAFRNLPKFEDEHQSLTNIEIYKKSASLLNTTVEQVENYCKDLNDAVEIWERDGNDDSVSILTKVLREAPNLTSPLSEQYFFSYTGFLVSVSLVVLQHFGLSPHLRLMNAQGYVRDSVFVSRSSRSLISLIPESLIGRLSGIRYNISDEGNIDISHVSFEGAPRLLPQRMASLSKYTGGNLAVLLTSATSMLEQSPTFHINHGPDYVLRRPNAGDGWKYSRYKFLPLYDSKTGKPLRFSGSKFDQRDVILSTIVDELLKGGEFSKLNNAIEQNDVVNGVGRKAGFVVNSYEQCKLIYEHIRSNYPAWRQRVRYLSRVHFHGDMDDNAVTASEVESLGTNKSWDLLIFPMNAIGRGVNIVYQYGERINKAMIGSLFFLTRPHPRGDSLQLIQGIVAKESEAYDGKKFCSTVEALQGLVEARSEAYSMVQYLLRQPLMSQRLGEYAEPFVANQIIIILQTIGRTMRGDCPAFIYFVDSAWAPRSAIEEEDNASTSMLIMMQDILRKCLNHESAAKRECYENLYQTFFEPLNDIENLIKEIK